MNSRASSLSGILIAAVALAVLAHPTSAPGGQPTVLRVGPGEQYATIQEAADAASQGSRILVYPGTYPEAVSITKSHVQILAQGEHVNVQSVGPDDQPGFTVLANYVTIRGFNIGFGGGCRAAISFEGSHNTFADNYMFQDRDCLGATAVSGSSETGGIDYNVIEGNTINHGDEGIALGAGPGYLNRGNIIRDNIITDIATDPIGILNGVGFLVSGNRIEGSSAHCIDVRTQAGQQPRQGHHTIVGNYMQICKDGIGVYAQALAVMTNNRIADNTIVGCDARCIALTADLGATVTNNKVSANSITPSSGMVPTSGDGIVLEVVGPGGVVNKNLIRGNRVSFGGDGIVVTSGADNNRISKNEVRSNLGVGISVSGNNNSIVGNAAENNDLANSGLWDLADFGQGNRWSDNTYDTANF